MAPRQHLGLEADERSDQFCYAIVGLRDILAGISHPSLRGQVPHLFIGGHARKGPAAAQDAKVPNRIRKILLKSLAVRPQERVPFDQGAPARSLPATSVALAAPGAGQGGGVGRRSPCWRFSPPPTPSQRRRSSARVRSRSSSGGGARETGRRSRAPSRATQKPFAEDA